MAMGLESDLDPFIRVWSRNFRPSGSRLGRGLGEYGSDPHMLDLDLIRRPIYILIRIFFIETIRFL